MDVFVAPKDFVATHSGGRVALYDPEGTTRRALESIGLNVHKVTKMQSVTGSRLIIGREALSALSSTFIQELLSFVDNGGRVLVLKQNGEQLQDSQLIPQGIVAKKNNYLFVITARQGLMAKNLLNRNFFFCNPYK